MTNWPAQQSPFDHPAISNGYPLDAEEQKAVDRVANRDIKPTVIPEFREVVAADEIEQWEQRERANLGVFPFVRGDNGLFTRKTDD